MKLKLILSLPLAFGALSVNAEVAQAASTEVDKSALVNEAKGAVKALAGPLQVKLKTAMQAGGPASAIDVCQKIAPALADSVSAEKGVEITRVSLKNRNPDMGVPSDWQAKVLEDFENRKQAGEDPMKISYAEIVDEQFRFMKAVPTAAICLQCHGTEMKPEVSEALGKAYPDDKAVGYKEGDIRGAFVVVKDLD